MITAKSANGVAHISLRRVGHPARALLGLGTKKKEKTFLLFSSATIPSTGLLVMHSTSPAMALTNFAASRANSATTDSATADLFGTATMLRSTDGDRPAERANSDLDVDNIEVAIDSFVGGGSSAVVSHAVVWAPATSLCISDFEAASICEGQPAEAKAPKYGMMRMHRDTQSLLTYSACV